MDEISLLDEMSVSYRTVSYKNGWSVCNTRWNEFVICTGWNKCEILDEISIPDENFSFFTDFV